jgi:hypothetical protein
VSFIVTADKNTYIRPSNYITNFDYKNDNFQTIMTNGNPSFLSS